MSIFFFFFFFFETKKNGQSKSYNNILSILTQRSQLFLGYLCKVIKLHAIAD